jgi:hypothetical protein
LVPPAATDTANFANSELANSAENLA